ncbi:peptidase S54 [Paenibacillus dendritiformis]|nr:peptidase S54 [Paenibacillus dendritiformis]
MLRQYRILLLLATSMAVGFAVTGSLTKDYFFFKACAAIFLLVGLVGLQYILIFRVKNNLVKYARFCSWCYLQSQTPTIAIASLILIAGGVQYYAQLQAGSLFDLVESVGLVFELARAEPWRYLIGPLMHAGPAHWMGNFLLLLIVAGLSFPIGRPLGLWMVFLAGVFAPAFSLAFLPHWVRSDAFLGVSGGVFAMYGWIVGVAYKNRRRFPCGFSLVLGYFAVAMTLISSLLDPRASWFVHSLGLVIGLAIGLLNIGIKLDFSVGTARADKST